jgi:hypothetical protein
MATRHFDNASLADSSEYFLISSNQVARFAPPFRQAPGYNERRTPLPGSMSQVAVADTHALARGVRWAFAIEGGAALLIYAAWYLWHLLL